MGSINKQEKIQYIESINYGFNKRSEILPIFLHCFKCRNRNNLLRLFILTGFCEKATFLLDECRTIAWSKFYYDATISPRRSTTAASFRAEREISPSPENRNSGPRARVRFLLALRFSRNDGLAFARPTDHNDFAIVPGLTEAGFGVEYPFRSLGNYGGCSSVGRAPDCGSGGRGFEPLQPPCFTLRLTIEFRLSPAFCRLDRDRFLSIPSEHNTPLSVSLSFDGRLAITVLRTNNEPRGFLSEATKAPRPRELSSRLPFNFFAECNKSSPP